MGCARQGRLAWPPAPLLILTSFELASLAMSGLEVFIRIILALVQHWELPWHQFSGLTVLKVRSSSSLPWSFSAQMPTS